MPKRDRGCPSSGATRVVGEYWDGAFQVSWIEVRRRYSSCGDVAGAHAAHGATTPHLVVDEGQDLSPGFYRLVRIAAASVTVFADER